MEDHFWTARRRSMASLSNLTVRTPRPVSELRVRGCERGRARSGRAHLLFEAGPVALRTLHALSALGSRKVSAPLEVIDECARAGEGILDLAQTARGLTSRDGLLAGIAEPGQAQDAKHEADDFDGRWHVVEEFDWVVRSREVTLRVVEVTVGGVGRIITAVYNPDIYCTAGPIQQSLRDRFCKYSEHEDHVLRQVLVCKPMQGDARCTYCAALSARHRASGPTTGIAKGVTDTAPC